MKEKVDAESFEAVPTCVAAKTIKAIDKGTVHRICSGQVVLTLGTAVKELVENCLDAGATSIEIRLKDYGSTLIEISDNGKGVEPHDFIGLTLKHHTSKLQEFSDLIGVKTFGFRGEALSSLCALSNLCIVTRHSEQAVGTKLSYDSNGHLISQSSVPRQIGTTVSLENLFYTLPVRHKEFQRNLKKEFNKMVQILYSYCIISTNVRINCTNISDSGKKTTIVSTCGYPSIKDNISSIFGAKQVSTLLEVKKKSASTEQLTEFGMDRIDPSEDCNFDFEGYISSCAHNLGRSASDRQFFYINNRPCDPTKVCRIINEIYHYFNRHQFPCVVLNILTNSGDVDVNVTPDKRQIFVNQEKLLLATLKTTLMALYENIPSSYALQNQTLISATYLTKCSSPKPLPTPTSQKLSRFSRSPLVNATPSSPIIIDSPSPSMSVKRWQSFSNDDCDSIKPKQPKLDCLLESDEDKNNISDIIPEELIHSSSANQNPEVSSEDARQNDSNLQNMEDSTDFNATFMAIETNGDCEPTKPKPEFISFNKDGLNDSSISSVTQSIDKIPVTPSQNCAKIHSVTDNFLSNLKAKKSLNKKNSPNSNKVLEHSSPKKVPEKVRFELKVPNSPLLPESQDVSDEVEIIHEEFDDRQVLLGERRKSLTVDFSLLSLREKLSNKAKKSLTGNLVRRFRANISPTENESAEGELKKEITKDMFAKMEILGQFNLGFIIIKLKSDLFIIDQHATDEKYNFETLEKTCSLQNQRLIHPHRMELTAVNESIILENIEIFNMNGFEFKIDEDFTPGRRVSLVSMPHSHGWEFKREDVEELIFMLSDAPGVMCRPSRIRTMFASRACRKSVMIGTALSSSQMRSLVNHMGQIEQPWNCPHGRPTMRHLINIDLISKS